MKEAGKKSRVIEVYSLIFIDLLCTGVAVGLSAFLRQVYDVNVPLDRRSSLLGCVLSLLCCCLYNILVDGNRDFFRRGKYKEFVAVVKCTVTVMITALVIMFFLHNTYTMSRMVFAVFAVLDVVITYTVHTLYKKWMLAYYRKSGASTKVLIVTSSERGTTLMEQLKINMPWDCDLIAAAVMDAVKLGYDMNGVPVVANAENLYEAAGKMAVDEVLIDLPDYPSEKIKQLVADLEQMGVTCNCCIHTFSIDGVERSIETFGNRPVVSYTKTTIDFRQALVKRAIDIVGSLVGLIITAVITPFVALAIRIESPGPIFFAQERVGRNGRRFKIYKFRSMYIDAEERKKELMEKNQMSGLMFKMDDDPRITKVGKFIRKTSIDELPQFYNILIGQMSLVGTRPPTVDEFNQYNLHYKRRLSMTPGLTGMWQVSGRSSITDFDEVVKLDLEYIDNWSVGLDIKILFMTVVTVLFRRGAV